MTGARRQVFVRIKRLRIDAGSHAGLSVPGVSSDIQAAVAAALVGTSRPAPGHAVGGLIAGEVVLRVRESFGSASGGLKAGPRR
jgi:hypothetical protein